MAAAGSRARPPLVSLLAGRVVEVSVRARRLAVAVCAVCLADGLVAGCYDSSQGQVIGLRGTRVVQQFPSPEQGVCHNFVVGADTVSNLTGVDLVLHQGRDCTDPAGAQSFYLVEQTTTLTPPKVGVWRSFATVGWPPP